MPSAIRFNQNTDRYSNTSVVTPMAGASTILAWHFISVDRNAQSNIWSFDITASTTFSILAMDVDGTTLKYFASDAVGGVTSLTGANLTVGTWYRTAVTITANGGNAQMYWGAQGAALSQTGTLALTSKTPTKFWVASDQANEFLNGRIAFMKLYGRVLTTAEMEREWSWYKPIDYTGLVASYSFRTGPSTADLSGNGRTLTADTTTGTIEAGPPGVDFEPLYYLPPALTPGVGRGPWTNPQPWFGTGSDQPSQTTDTVFPAAGGSLGLAGTQSDSGTTSVASSPADGYGGAGVATASGAAAVSTLPAGALGGAGRQTIAETIFTTPARVYGGAGTATTSGAATVASAPSESYGGAGSSTATGAATITAAPTRGHGQSGAQTITAAAAVSITAGRAGGSSGAQTITGTATTASLPTLCLAGPLSSSVTGAATVTGVAGPALGLSGSAAATATTLQAAQPSGAMGAGPSTPTTGTAALSGSPSGALGKGSTVATSGTSSVTSAPTAAIGAGSLANATATTLQSALPAGALALGALATITATATLSALTGRAGGSGTTTGASGTATAISLPSGALGRPGATTALTTIVVLGLPGRVYGGAGTFSIGEVFVPTGPTIGQMFLIRRQTSQIVQQPVVAVALVLIVRDVASAMIVNRASSDTEQTDAPQFGMSTTARVAPQMNGT
jgi:Concanavalin A-like lectin/glucanases superfamily